MTITAERQDDRDNEPCLGVHTCFWCKTPFVPADECNHVHLGGHGMVWGCDSCLDLKQ